MNPKEAGFLLLTSHLGNPERKVLTLAQFRTLAQRVQWMPPPEENRQLEWMDLTALGYGPEFARRILALLEEVDVLEHYLRRGARLGCIPISRISSAYPRAFKQKLGLEAPGCLWAKGDLSLLDGAKVALVGSRDLGLENQRFAAEAGRQAAYQGYTLVSGNARGADRTAQNACLETGGRVISIVADELGKQPDTQGVLYLSEDGFDEAFSAQRALSRNRCIHTLADKTLVAQCTLGQGGTWHGTKNNLRHGWSHVLCFDDGSQGSAELIRLGATPIGIGQLGDFQSMQTDNETFF